MITTNSGCFASNRQADQIDDIKEAAEALQDIENSDSTETSQGETPVDAVLPQLAAVMRQYANRLRVLTWAFIALAVYVFVKEVKR